MPALPVIFRKRAGMIWSVSMFSCGTTTTRDEMFMRLLFVDGFALSGSHSLRSCVDGFALSGSHSLRSCVDGFALSGSHSLRSCVDGFALFLRLRAFALA